MPEASRNAKKLKILSLTETQQNTVKTSSKIVRSIYKYSRLSAGCSKIILEMSEATKITLYYMSCHLTVHVAQIVIKNMLKMTDKCKKVG